MVLCLWGATGSLALAYALGGAAALLAGMCALRARKAAQTVKRADLFIAYRGGHAAFEAMIDSGNTLRDYLTHLPVIVIPQATAQKALRIGNTPLRPIFAQTAGGRQRMDVLSPEAIDLAWGGTRRSVRAVVALSPMMSADVPALVPAALLEEQGN